MLKWILTILTVFGFSGSSVVAAVLDEGQFSQAFAVKVQEINSSAKAEVTGHLEVHVELPGGKISTAFLDNVYRLYKAAPDDLQPLLKEYAQHTISQAYGGNENVNSPILPVVRAFESFTSVSPEILTSGGKGLEYIPLTGDTGIFFVKDGDQSVSYISHEEFSKLGVSKEELFATSLNSLNSVSHPTNVAASKMLALVVGDMYASSLIFSDAYWQKFPQSFKGDLVVFPIARDTFIVTGTGEQEGLEEARQLAIKFMADAAYPISSLPLVRVHGSWRALD